MLGRIPLWLWPIVTTYLSPPQRKELSAIRYDVAWSKVYLFVCNIGSKTLLGRINEIPIVSNYIILVGSAYKSFPFHNKGISLSVLSRIL